MSEEQKPDQPEVEGQGFRMGRNEEPVTEPEDKAAEEREPDVEGQGARVNWRGDEAPENPDEREATRFNG